MNLTEIGQQIQTQRQGLLSQEQLAHFTGLSRVTINQLENGTLADLGVAKLMNVLGVLGMDIQANPAKGLNSALTIAARTISTSYKEAITPAELARILRTGTAPEKYHPHLMTLLDETPLPIVLKAVKEAAGKTPAKQIMKHLARWADEWQTHRAWK